MPLAQGVQAGIARHPGQPSRHTFVVHAEAVVPQAEQNLLGNILGVFAVAHIVEGECVNAVPVLLTELAETSHSGFP